MDDDLDFNEVMDDDCLHLSFRPRVQVQAIRRHLERIRISTDFPWSPDARLVIDELQVCGAVLPYGGLHRCMHPLCALCGKALSDELADRKAQQVRQWMCGPGEVSVITICDQYCRSDELETAFRSFRVKLERRFRRHLTGCNALGELELVVWDRAMGDEKTGIKAQKGNRFQRVEILLSDRDLDGVGENGGKNRIVDNVRFLFMPHWQGIVGHPGITRKALRAILREHFGKDMYSAVPVRNRTKKGQPVDGIRNWLSYSFDRSQALKKEHRWLPSRRLAQSAALDGYARLMLGKKKRLKFEYTGFRIEPNHADAVFQDELFF